MLGCMHISILLGWLTRCGLYVILALGLIINSQTRRKDFMKDWLIQMAHTCKFIVMMPCLSKLNLMELNALLSPVHSFDCCSPEGVNLTTLRLFPLITTAPPPFPASSLWIAPSHKKKKGNESEEDPVAKAEKLGKA